MRIRLSQCIYPPRRDGGVWFNQQVILLPLASNFFILVCTLNLFVHPVTWMQSSFCLCFYILYY